MQNSWGIVMVLYSSAIVTGNVIVPSVYVVSPKKPTMGLEDLIRILSTRSIQSPQDLYIYSLLLHYQAVPYVQIGQQCLQPSPEGLNKDKLPPAVLLGEGSISDFQKMTKIAFFFFGSRSSSPQIVTLFFWNLQLVGFFELYYIVAIVQKYPLLIKSSILFIRDLQCSFQWPEQPLISQQALGFFFPICFLCFGLCHWESSLSKL